MIKISKVSKYFGKIKIVDNLSLSINEGSVFGFLGPNGAGKTTTIKMIVGLSKPDDGKITIDGKNPLFSKTKKLIGFMPENPNFYDYLTGEEFLQFCFDLTLNKIDKNSDLVSLALEEVGISEAKDKKVKYYSKGMKQRLGLASALVADPKYIFLDEPLDGLDPIGRIEVKKIILKLKNSGKTVFLNSHILSDVEEICDQIGIIDQGKLIFEGSVKSFCKGESLEKKFIELIEKNSK